MRGLQKGGFAMYCDSQIFTPDNIQHMYAMEKKCRLLETEKSH